MRIGILGGTFDPVHKAHLALAHAARKQLSLDKILFIPALIPPHKAERAEITPPEARYEMVRLAVQGEATFEVSRIELDRGGVSYTVDTVRELQKEYPGAEFFLIMGEDGLSHFPQWREADEIKKNVRFAVARRPGISPGRLSGAAITWLDMPEYPYASSTIRENIGRSGLSAGVLPEAVAEYIRKQRLYGSCA